MFATVIGSKKCAYIDYASPNADQSKAFILSPGLGDLKEEYRLLGPKLATAFPNFRVIGVDLRGMGKSDTGFTSYTPEDTGHDLIAVIKELNLKEVILVGCSMSAASILIPAAESCANQQTARFRVTGLVLLSPFAWDHAMPFGIPTLLNVLLNSWTGSSFWTSYYRGLYTIKPCTVTDIDTYCHNLKVNVQQPGRMEALRGHLFGSKASCSKRIADIASDIPLLTFYGSKDPDFPDIAKESEELQSYFARQTKANIVIVNEAGHYPHVEAVEEVITGIVNFLR